MNIRKTISLFSTLILSIFSITLIVSLPKTVIAENPCISFDGQDNEISISCEYSNFIDIEDELQNQHILYRESKPDYLNEKNWILNAGIRVEKDATLNIDSKDVTWLKIVPGINTPNAIKVDGSLNVDSVKITSWNPETNDYVKFSDETKYNDTRYKVELRPYIKVNSEATGPTIIKNSELAYLGYSCSGCGGVSFNGGDYSVLKNNEIHHIYKGFYSKGMGYMLIEDNKVYSNEKYGIDPHTGTHDMLILNNVVYDNHNAGIICSADCYNILIEGNKVYNNGHGDNMRGIAVSKNVTNTIIRDNVVFNEDKCISIGRDSSYNSVYDNTISNCLFGVYITKSSYNNEIHNNNIENVGYGLVAADDSVNNLFHSNSIVGAEMEPIFEDESSTGNIFDSNDNIVSFGTLKRELGVN
ncbi:MAG: right-handed parallel beta-helix repeat-containing protein [Nitrososphaeraceae archaeon]